MWRWLCATGVYHAAANTVTVENLYEIGRVGGTVEEYLCQHQNVCARCEGIRPRSPVRNGRALGGAILLKLAR